MIQIYSQFHIMFEIHQLSLQNMKEKGKAFGNQAFNAFSEKRIPWPLPAYTPDCDQQRAFSIQEEEFNSCPRTINEEQKSNTNKLTSFIAYDFLVCQQNMVLVGTSKGDTERPRKRHYL